MGQSAAFYCRVSTADQSCARHERDLNAFVENAGHKMVGVWKETASGETKDRAKRKEILALAQARAIDVILVTELSRWGRSMHDLFHAAPRVLKLVGEGQSYREISHRLGLSKNTTLAVVKRDRPAA